MSLDHRDSVSWRGEPGEHLCCSGVDTFVYASSWHSKTLCVSCRNQQDWKNGEQVIDDGGPTAFNDQTGPYFKMGLYGLCNRVIHHDELRIGDESARYEDVEPGGSTPISTGMQAPHNLRATEH